MDTFFAYTRQCKRKSFLYIIPFYLINIFITKLLEEKPIRERRGFSSFCDKIACEIKYTVWMQAFFIWRKYTKISEMEIGTLLII